MRNFRRPIIFPLINVINNYGAIPFMSGRTPPPELHLRIFGVTKDNTGVALGNCTVHLFRADNNTFAAETISDDNGNYEFRQISISCNYYVRMYKVGSPDVAGTSVNTLVGT